MLRKLCSAAVLGLFCATLVYADDEKKPAEDKKPADDKKPGGKLAGKMDRGAMFTRMDADGDGKLTKEEYKKAMDGIMTKLKDSGKAGKIGDRLGGVAEKQFEQMDTEKKGFVTKEQFEKFEGALGGNLKGKLDPAELKKKLEERKKKE